MMVTKPNEPVRVDAHVHILNIPLSPDEFSTGQRFGLSRSEMAVFSRVVKLAKRVDLPEPAEEIVGIVDQVLEALPWTSQRWKGVKELLRLYVLPTRQAVQHLVRHLLLHGVHEACLLVPPAPGLKLKALRELADEVAISNSKVWFFPYNPRVSLFVPRWAHHMLPPGLVHGVKIYPSMESAGTDPLHAEEPCECGITHCSPGGIRALGLSSQSAKRLNMAGRWALALQTTRMRLVLAHAGGVDKFMDWMLRGQYAPGELWVLDNLLRDACPGMSEVPGQLWVDLAFHERMFEPAYARAIAAAPPWWKILPGTDYPLHLPFYDYERAIRRLSELVPDGARELRRFLYGVKS